MLSSTEVVDLFCGGGGFSVGAARTEGAKVVLAVDNVDYYGRLCLAHHARHHPGARHVALELGPQTEQELTALVEGTVSPGAHVHVHGSPPCQDFSCAKTKGKQALYEGGRQKLSSWFIAFVKRLERRLRETKAIFLTASLENVVHAAPFLNLKNAKTLAMTDFGCCTTRRRLVWAYRWAFQDLKKEKKPPPPRKAISTLRSFDVVIANTTRKPVRSLDLPFCTITTCTARQTNVARFGDDGEYKDKRRVTISELAEIQGFPSDYFDGLLITNAGKMCGNAICPPLARAVVGAARRGRQFWDARELISAGAE